MREIEVLVDERAIIGESPTWSAADASLYWIDVKEPALHRIEIASGARRRWGLSAEVGAFSFTDDGAAAIVALRTGIFSLDLASGAETRLVAPPFDPAFHRFNEGSCDPSGRFWVGVMFDPVPADAPPPRDHAAALHSFTRAGGLRAEPDLAELHNGMAWSPGGSQFFLSHSLTRTIYRHEVDQAGHLVQRHRFARVDDVDGIPDGAALDAAGGYWCALHGAGRLRRFHADGSVDRDVALPVSQPTMCAFGGTHLDVLYVTSAANGLTAGQRCNEPHAGALLCLRPHYVGVPVLSTCR